MTDSSNKLLFWSPRILTILFASFVSLFAFDVFDVGLGFWKSFLAFLIHLIPTGIILITLIISWKREWVGGVVFAVLPLLYIYQAWGRFPASVYILMCGPMILISALYFLNWKKRKTVGE